MSERRFSDPDDLLRDINPRITPEEAVGRVRAYNQIEFNATQKPVIRARKELLQAAGADPDEWVFYSAVARPEGRAIGEMMARIRRPFPWGVDLLIINGFYSGGVSTTYGVASGSVGAYEYNPRLYSAFIRVRPKQLEDKSQLSLMVDDLLKNFSED